MWPRLRSQGAGGQRGPGIATRKPYEAVQETKCVPDGEGESAVDVLD